jgi:hypothetical protein
MRPLLAWALLCIPPKIAALQAPSHGARPFSRPSIAPRSMLLQAPSHGARPFSRPSIVPRSMLRLEADDDRLSNFWRFWGRISDPLNAPSPQTGLSLIQSFENAFAAGQKVACYDGLEQVGKGLEKGLELGLKAFGLILAFIVISVAPTVPTWMKSVLWAGSGWAAWKQHK